MTNGQAPKIQFYVALQCQVKWGGNFGFVEVCMNILEIMIMFPFVLRNESSALVQGRRWLGISRCKYDCGMDVRRMFLSLHPHLHRRVPRHSAQASQGNSFFQTVDFHSRYTILRDDDTMTIATSLHVSRIFWRDCSVIATFNENNYQKERPSWMKSKNNWYWKIIMSFSLIRNSLIRSASVTHDIVIFTSGYRSN